MTLADTRIPRLPPAAPPAGPAVQAAPGDRLGGLFWALLAVIALSPLPFGSARPWAWSLIALAAGVLLILWCWRLSQRGDPPAVALRRIGPSAILVGLVILYAVLQTVPGLPPGLANPYWQMVAEVGGTPRDSISITPMATITMAMRLAAYAAIFWLVLQLARPARRAEQVVQTLAFVGAAYCTYGLVAYFTGSNTILWYQKWAYLDSLTSTFVNRNSFATYAGIGILCTLAALARQFLADRGRGITGLAGWLSRPSLTVVLLLAAIQLQLVALFLSRSRAGTAVSLFAALVFLAGLAWQRRGQRIAALTGLAVFAAALGLFFWFSGAGLIERLGWLESELPLRLNAYRLTIQAIGDFPWLGVGFGGFEDVFKLYRDTTIDVYFDMAHDTYLENALELGIPAAAALFAAVALLAIRCLAAWRRRRSVFIYGWAAFCASLLVGLHALIDFSLQIPAVTVTFLALLATGVAQSWSSLDDTSKPRPNTAARNTG